MPNNFGAPKVPSPGRAPHLRNGLSDSPIARTVTGSPGLWQRTRLRARQSQAVANIRSAELDVVETEAKALVVQAARMHGTEVRAEITREHSTVLAATVNEAVRDFTAITQEQRSIRMAGSFVNLRALAETRKDIDHFAQEMPVLAEEVDAMLANAKDLHVEQEGRIDRAYEFARDLTDRNFELGVAPAKSILSQS